MADDPSSTHGDLPPVRGRIVRNRPMADLSWLRVGGPADILFQPADAEDLAACLAALPADMPVLPMGVASNLIIRDGGIEGMVIRLGRPFASVAIEPEGRIRAGAAVLDARLAEAAAEAGLAGLEFLRTIPGTVGGAVRMNAGCYGAYVADVLVEVTLVDRTGSRTLPAEALGLGYRHASLPPETVITEALFQGRPDAPEAIVARMQEALARRAESQPVADRSCGSTFRNPAGYSSTGAPDDPNTLKAWKLIEDAGCRGLCLGGAQISQKHANFLINAGGATAAELEALGEEVRKRVLKTAGISLEWEIMRVGRALPPAQGSGTERA
ncbi:MAG: UDP-N-acetylmuramate dehydrogenase [Pseudomonadota bacterium]